MSNIENFQFELDAIKEFYEETSDEHPKSLADLMSYNCNIPIGNR